MVEQRLGTHQDSREAVAALARLLIQKRLLQRMRLHGGAEPFDGCDATSGDRADLARAGVDRLAIEQHHAASALLQAATVSRAFQIEPVAQNVQQWRHGFRRDARPPAVHVSAMSCAMDTSA